MPIPEFESIGDLPVGVHQATLGEVITRFGHGTPQRQIVTERLIHIHDAAKSTGKLIRLVIYGSYVTAKPSPNDVDIILIMRDDFDPFDCDAEAAIVFHHLQAHDVLGASVFWAPLSGILLATVDQFIAGWQIKRDLGLRGIVEVLLEQ
jgi:hypothetical protein